MEAAARQLIAGIGGTLIGCYRTSGDHDLLLIFEAPSYEEAVPALDAAAAGSGVTDLTTVRVPPRELNQSSFPSIALAGYPLDRIKRPEMFQPP